MEIPTNIILRRVGIIGDIHGEDRALFAVLDMLLRRRDLDALLCTGDLIDRRSVGDGCRCCHLLADAGVYTVRGEFDKTFDSVSDGGYHNGMSPRNDAANAFLASLPTARTFRTVAGSPLLLCHDFGEQEHRAARPGNPDDAAAAALEQQGMETCPFIVAGHSHRHGVRRIGETIVIDAGSLYWEDHPCFSIADFEAGFVQFYSVAPFTNHITPAERLELWKNAPIAV